MTTEPKVADLPTKWVNECSQAAPETRWDAGYDAAQRMCACELVAALSWKDAPKATPLHGPHGSIAFDADGQPAGKVKKNCPPPSWMFQNDEGNVDAQPEQQGAVDVAHALEVLRVVTSRAMQGSETREAFEVVKAALAARQPVGQRYRFVDGSAGGLMIEDADGEWVRYTAPPAQVDLAAIRRELSDALDLLDNATAEGDEDANRIGLAELAITRVVEAIDQQAGKGVRHG